MGGLTSAVHWWEESQLRVLVLTSMAVQVLLFILSSLRRSAVPGWVRSITWLAYLAGDAVAIYALATLFNRRHKDDQGSNIISTLEVMWAPVLLLHLGGHDRITAYNIEDNELWSRHLVTVAIYVFCKSWPPDGDKRLLLTGILLFIPGVLKCFLKAWALKSASIYSLVSSSSRAAFKKKSSPRAATARQNEEEDMYPLQEYVKRAKEESLKDGQENGNKNIVDDVATPAEDDGCWAQCCRALLRDVHQRRQRIGEQLQQLVKLEWPPSGKEDEDQSQGSFSSKKSQGSVRAVQLFQQYKQLWNEHHQVRKRLLVLGEASDKLFVDLSSPYPLRLRILKYFWGLSEDRAYGHAQGGLVAAFLLLYTRLKTQGFVTYTEMAPGLNFCHLLKISCRWLIQYSRVVLPWASIGLFHQSHCSEEARNDIIDVKITYAIFCCTAVLEFFAAIPIGFGDLDDVYLSQERVLKWPEMVAQYSLIGYFASSKKYSYLMCIAGIFGCKDFVDQKMLRTEPRSSSARISRLVLEYLKDGWKEQIHDAPSYRKFNDHSTHWPELLRYLEEGHHVGFNSSMRKRPFDESVLLWHIATDICFFWIPTVSKHRCHFAEVQTSWKTSLLDFLGVPKTRSNEQHQCRPELTPCRAVLCRQMSNYMAHLLFVNPEMLLPGTRRNLFIDAYNGLNDILKDMDMDRKPPNVKEDEWVMQQRVISTMQKWNRSKAFKPCSEEEPKKISPPEEEESPLSKEKSNKKGGYYYKEKLIHDAWALAQRLLDKSDEKMWEEIQHVWVEMLCFSASRCRGYLHAKALDEGGEFLSYVWLTLFYMGMETFTDKLQREEPPSVSHEGNNGNAPPPSTASPSTWCEVSTGITPSTFEVHASACTAPSTSSEICMAEDDMV